MTDDRRSFLKKTGLMALGIFASMFTVGTKKDVELLSLVDEAHAIQDNMPEPCRSGSPGLTRCKKHWGQCEGQWHTCSGHQSGGRGSGCRQKVQCKDHNFRRGPTD
ncbi:MAG: hypothetical protein N3A62_02800 [Thermodesulfovibrionales bacterium]|nr:hypothetical protein [Thermodesulfovibrionales bacterium]